MPTIVIREEPKKTPARKRRLICNLTFVFLLGISDYGLDVYVIVDWLFNEDYWWASLGIIFIFLSGLMSWSTNLKPTVAYDFCRMPWRRTFLYIIGLGFTFEYVQLWKTGFKDIKNFSMMKVWESMFESLPSGALQLYVLFLNLEDENEFNMNMLVKVVSIFISILSLSHGLISGMTSRFTNIGSDSLFATLAAGKWKYYFIVWTFVSTDFILRVGSVVLLMVCSETRNLDSHIWMPFVTYVFSYMTLCHRWCGGRLTKKNAAIFAFMLCFSDLTLALFEKKHESYTGIPEFISRLLYSISLIVIYFHFSWNYVYFLTLLFIIILNIAARIILYITMKNEQIVNECAKNRGGEYKDIWQCAKDGNVKKLKEFLEEYRVDAEDEDDRCPLIHACRSESSECVELLIKRGAYINNHDRWGNTPASIAAAKNDHAILQLLIDAKAELWVGGYEDQTPIMRAVVSDAQDCLKMILEAEDPSTDPPQRKLDIAYEGLNWAIRKGYPRCVQMLLDHGVDIHKRDLNFHTQQYPTPEHLECYEIIKRVRGEAV